MTHWIIPLRQARRFCSVMVLLAMAAAGGCQAVGYAAYVFAPDLEKKTQEAEFAGLPGQSLAVVVYVRPEVVGEFPDVEKTVASRIGEEIRRNVKDVQIVDAGAIIRWQRANPQWQTMPRTKLAAALKCDYLLLVSLVEYGTREPGNSYTIQGNLLAEAMLFDAAKDESQALVKRWPDLHATFPEGGPTDAGGANDERFVRLAIEGKLADQLAKKFYKHTIEVKR